MLSLKLIGWYSLQPHCCFLLHSLALWQWSCLLTVQPWCFAGVPHPCLSDELYGCCCRKRGPCSVLVKNTSPLHHLIILLSENKWPSFSSAGCYSPQHEGIQPWDTLLSTPVMAELDKPHCPGRGRVLPDRFHLLRIRGKSRLVQIYFLHWCVPFFANGYTPSKDTFFF